MLQFIRNLFKNWIGISVLAVLVAVAFLFFGIEGYFSQQSAPWVAKVDGHKISQQEFTTALNDYRVQHMGRSDEATAANGLSTSAVKRRILTRLINQRLLLDEDAKLGIVVPDSVLRAQIASFPEFQVDGKFDSSVYLAALAQRGETAQQFQDAVRNELAVRALPTLIADTAFATREEADALLRLQLQQRDFAYVTLPAPAPTAAQSRVSNAEVAAYYKQHVKAFRQPERVSINYVDLDAATLKVAPALSAKSLHALYVKERAKFVVPPQWEVSHILIQLPAKPTAAERAAALAKAKKIDALARAPGANFAALAKKYSDDLGSKRQGGNLGWLQPGDVGPRFQAALEHMQKGQISGPVLTSDGYHIIDLRNVRNGRTRTFAQVRAQLARQAKTTARIRAYRKLANAFTNLIYSNPTPLRAAAEKLGLVVRTTPLFGRKGTKVGLASNPKVIKAAFSNLVLVQGSTSNPIHLGAHHIVVIHLNKVVPAAPAPLEQVTGKIRRDIVQARVDATARRFARTEFAKLEGGEHLATLAKATGRPLRRVSAATRRSSGLDPKLLASVFKLARPTAKRPTRALIPLGDGTYALVVLRAVNPGDVAKVPVAARSFLRQEMTEAQGAADVAAFLGALRSAGRVEVAAQRA